MLEVKFGDNNYFQGYVLMKTTTLNTFQPHVIFNKLFDWFLSEMQLQAEAGQNL